MSEQPTIIKKCQCKNHNSIDVRNHSAECLFNHFMAYTNGQEETLKVQEKLRKAFFDGYDAGGSDCLALQAKHSSAGVVELSNFVEAGGSILRCYEDGRIELSEVSQYGGKERLCGSYHTINAALVEAEKLT